MAVKSSDQITIVDLTDGYSIMLSLDAISLNGDVSTLGTAQSVTVNVTAYKGGAKVVPTVGTPTCPTNVTASVGSASNSVVPVTISFAAALSTAGKVTIPVTVDDVTINKEFAFGIAFKGAVGATGPKGDTGATGAAAYSYDLIVSHAAIAKSIDGTYNPTSITLTAKRSQGTGSPANYSGRFKIDTTTDGSTWTSGYTSSADEATKTYTIPSGIIAVRCNLYLAGGTATLIDQQTIPVVSDGATGATGATGSTGETGAAGADAYTVILGNESHSFAAGTSAAKAGNTVCPVIAFKGATQVPATIGTISGAPTGMTTSIADNGTTTAQFTVTVTTSMKTAAGVLTVPVTVDGKAFSKRFSYSLSLTGAKGATGDTGATGETGPKGDTGADGEDAILLKITTSAGDIFKNSSGSTILTAHAYVGGVEVTGSSLTALGAIKWYKDGTYMSGKDGVSLTVNASDISSKSTYEARLEA